ncbi:MAG: hypothetical protein ABW147_03180 [Candidatus Thiodiazotropha sp.]
MTFEPTTHDLILNASGGKLYLHVEDIEKVVNVSRRTVYRMKKAGTGPRWQDMGGRSSVFVGDLADWIEERQMDVAKAAAK